MFHKALLGVFCLTILFACSSNSSSTAPVCREYWVSPDGSASGAGSESDPFLTLEQARDTIRTDSSRTQCTIQVNLKGGTYRLSEPLTLDAQDSGGLNAPVIYQAAPGETPVISGARQVTGWTLVDPVLNIWQAQASVDTELMPRQLYVNGVRATRARTVDFPNYYIPTSTGYFYLYLGGSDPQIPPTWNNPTAVEAVTATQWKMMRCPVSEVILSSDVIMQNPCWNNANVFPEPWNFHLLSWLENAYEFLDQPGEWYLDPVTQVLYYIPLSGEDMAAADVELPVLETLVDAVGTVSAPVAYLQFKGLSFEYATWLAPSGSDGYALDQSGFHLVGADHSANLIGHDQNDVETPGNVRFIYAQNISLSGNTFEHLGAAALSFETGSQNDQIVNNIFTDISSSAIQLGGIQIVDHHPSVAAELTSDNLISNNLVEYTGREFYDTAGIYVGFTTRSTVEHNDINHVPWSGIAIGWGWGMLDPGPGGFAGLPNGTPYQWGVWDTPSAAHQNQIIYNHIQYFLEKLWDGGAIYSTGFQGTSMGDGQLIAWNVAENKRSAAGGNTFYTDGGSRYVTVYQNVSLNNPQGTFDFGPCLKDSSFDTLCLSTGIVPYGTDMGGCVPFGDLVFAGNYFRDQLAFYDICTNTYFPDYPIDMTFSGNVKVSSSSQVPSSILNAAGRQ
jgi:hypothetical protein